MCDYYFIIKFHTIAVAPDNQTLTLCFNKYIKFSNIISFSNHNNAPQNPIISLVLI